MRYLTFILPELCPSMIRKIDVFLFFHYYHIRFGLNFIIKIRWIIYTCTWSCRLSLILKSPTNIILELYPFCGIIFQDIWHLLFQSYAPKLWVVSEWGLCNTKWEIFRLLPKYTFIMITMGKLLVWLFLDVIWSSAGYCLKFNF